MKSQITMKDIAAHFGVSLNTVHKAISGKPGISDATRARILLYAQENGYQLNAIASILKRKHLNIVVCLPELDENSQYFYQDIWNGCRKYLKEWEDLNIQTEEITFSEGMLSPVLAQLAAETRETRTIDGLLTIPPKDETGTVALKSLSKNGTAIIFVTEDNPDCPRIGSVVGDYHAAGQLMAEQICNLLKPGAKICLMAGNPKNEAHCLVAQGCMEYLQENAPHHTIEPLYGYYQSERLDEKILQLLRNDPPEAVMSVFARGSAVLYKALQESDLAGKIPVIANDIFPENVEALNSGAFTNLVFKDPYRQAYLAMKMLCEYLVKDTLPENPVKKVEIRLIFRSNLKYYLP